jgi:hypothetical protein
MFHWFNIKEFSIYPIESMYGSRVSLTLNDFFLSSINLLMFILHTQCVFCEVGIYLKKYYLD